jgi:hypothetical protein
MEKINKKLEALNDAFFLNQLETYINSISPQEIGNLLYLVNLKIKNYVDYQLRMIDNLNKEKIDNLNIFRSLINGIKKMEEKEEKWRDIKKALEKNKKT